MKTPKERNKIQSNKLIFNSAKTSKKYKMKGLSKARDQLYDEIELQNLNIKDYNKKIKKIKLDSIKELVYTNKFIPLNWKAKKEYPIQVLEAFSKDSNFLKYVGSGENESGSGPKETPKTTRNLNLTNYTKRESNKRNHHINRKLSILNENNKNEKYTKYFNTTPSRNRYISLKHKVLNEKQVINILDELNSKYPIKGKLLDLFSEDEIKSNKFLNEKLKCQTSKARGPVGNSVKQRNILRNNIYVNLISSPKNKTNKINNEKDEEYLNKRYLNLYDIDLMKMRKEIIKNPLATKYLEKISYYGPYYSYCPPCGINNLLFYKKLPLEQLMAFTNLVRNYREPKLI